MGSRPAAARSFTIEVAAPFRLDLTVWALRRRAHNVIDRFDGRCYQRTLVLCGQPAEAAVRQQDGGTGRRCSWWSCEDPVPS